MKIVNTENLTEELKGLPPEAHLWIYNGFDVLLPHEIREVVEPRLTENQRAIYDFERNLQGPALSMMLNGVRVDEQRLAETLAKAESDREELEKYALAVFTSVWDRDVNIRSPEQLKQLFYYDPMGFGLKPKYKASQGKRTVTTERKALEEISTEAYYTQPVVSVILALRDIGKEIEFLKRGVESDGRVRCSFNVAATESGRWSSSANPWGRGANFQNQPEYVRGIYVADVGEILGYPDLAQAESRGVAYYSRDPNYIQAVESGDLHSAVAKMVWPKIEDPNDIFYRHFTYRDMAKRGGHATNYLGTPWMVAKHLRVEQGVIEEFQSDYFNAFPGIRAWHKDVQRELQNTGKLTTALGRERTFFGRLTDEKVLKEAVAWYPQSTISDILKIGMLRVWRELEAGHSPPRCRLFADMHDGLLLGISEIHLDAVVERIKALMTVGVRFPDGGVMRIPVDIKVGYRWDKSMVPWRPGILGDLSRPTIAESLLDLPATGV